MKRNVLYALSFAFVVALFVITAMYSYGFDDETYNFFFVEKLNSLSEIIKFINSTDIHPVGMYVLNYISLKLLGSWHLVKAVNGVLCACAAWLYWYVMSRDIRSKAALIFSYVAACISPSALIWCTSVRWYTYIMPLIVILALLIHFADTRKISGPIFWGIYFFVCLLMFHLGYFSSVIILISFLFLLYRRKNFLRSEWKYIAVYSIASLCLSSWQMYSCLTVHMKNRGIQRIGFSLGGAMNYLSGSAVMPISIYGIILIAANLILIFVFLKNIKYMFSDCDNNFFMASYALMMLLLLNLDSAKYFAILFPELGIFLTKLFLRIKNKSLKVLVLSMFIIGTAGGVYNAVAHENTTKATYNMPYTKIFKYMDSIDPEKKSLVVTNSRGMYFFASKERKNIMFVPELFDVNGVETPFLGDWYNTLQNWQGKIIAVKTPRYSTPHDVYEKYLAYMDAANIIEKRVIEYEKYASFKKKFKKDYLEYYAMVYLIENNPEHDE